MINKYKKNILPAASGFTLIETLVAVLLLATALAGPLTVASKSLMAAQVAKDQIVAFYLVQDAVEYVRFIRDSNKLAGNSWLAGLDGTVNGHTNSGGAGPNCISADGSVSCNLDSVADSGTTCSGGCSPLFFETSSGVYRTTGTVPPAFVRTVKIVTPVGTNDCTAGHGCEATMTVTVAWTDSAGVVHPGIVVNEQLFDWE